MSRHRYWAGADYKQDPRFWAAYRAAYARLETQEAARRAAEDQTLAGQFEAVQVALQRLRREVLLIGYDAANALAERVVNPVLRWVLR